MFYRLVFLVLFCTLAALQPLAAQSDANKTEKQERSDDGIRSIFKKKDKSVAQETPDTDKELKSAHKDAKQDVRAYKKERKAAEAREEAARARADAIKAQRRAEKAEGKAERADEKAVKTRKKVDGEEEKKEVFGELFKKKQ